MEKLHNSWHFYFHNDIRFLPDHLRWTIGIDDYRKLHLYDFFVVSLRGVLFDFLRVKQLRR